MLIKQIVSRVQRMSTLKVKTKSLSDSTGYSCENRVMVAIVRTAFSGHRVLTKLLKSKEMGLFLIPRNPFSY